MRTWLVLLLLCCWPRNARADEWWGRDKALHFTVSVGLSSASYALVAPLTEHREYRVMAAAGTSLAIGAGKEGYDALGNGDPSWRDFAWDVAGTAVGVLIAYAVDCIIVDPAHRTASPATATSPLVVAF
jgi:putative lipoprotein